MNRYNVRLYSKAYKDLEEIYNYIANKVCESKNACNLISNLEEAINSLEFFPNRGAIRKSETLKGNDYRQLFVKNYIIIYRVIEDVKEVHIITIKSVYTEY